jgi:hypothetical protein
MFFSNRFSGATLLRDRSAFLRRSVLASFVVCLSAGSVFAQGTGGNIANGATGATGPAAAGTGGLSDVGLDPGDIFGGNFTNQAGTGFNNAATGGTPFNLSQQIFGNGGTGALGGTGGQGTGIGGIGNSLGGLGGLGGFGGGLGGFGGLGGLGQLGNLNQDDGETKVRATVRLGFEVPGRTMDTRVSELSRRLQNVRLPERLQTMEVALAGRTAFLTGTATNGGDIRLMSRLLMLEPGIDTVQIDVQPVAEVVEPLSETETSREIRPVPVPVPVPMRSGRN